MFCVLELQQDIYLFTSALTLSMPVYRACKENIFFKMSTKQLPKCAINEITKKITRDR